MTIKIKTTSNICNTVVLDCMEFIFNDSTHVMFICNKRQASDILIKLSMNPIFSKLEDITAYKRLDAYFIEITATEPFQLSVSGVLE